MMFSAKQKERCFSYAKQKIGKSNQNSRPAKAFLQGFFHTKQLLKSFIQKAQL